jgi:hypothetical protein
MNGVSFLSMAVRVLIILLRQAMSANGWGHANHPALAAGCGRTGDDDAGRAGVARLLDLSAAGVYLRRAAALSQTPHLT